MRKGTRDSRDVFFLEFQVGCNELEFIYLLGVNIVLFSKGRGAFGRSDGVRELSVDIRDFEIGRYSKSQSEGWVIVGGIWRLYLFRRFYLRFYGLVLFIIEYRTFSGVSNVYLFFDVFILIKLFKIFEVYQLFVLNIFKLRIDLFFWQ